MGCAKIENKLIAYLELRAAPADRRAVEQHLTECAACRARAAEFRALWGALDELPMISPSPSFDAAVRARIAAEPARRGLWAWMMPSPRLAFAVTLLVTLAVWVSSRPPVARPAAQPGSEAEFRMINDLPVLENYDVLASFEALSALPSKPGTAEAQPNM